MPPCVVILTGESGSGKTTVCACLARLARDAGLSVAGLLTQGCGEENVRTALVVQDLRSGDIRLLATMGDGARGGLVLGSWVFDREGIAWGRAVLRLAVPCDILIIDEIGPLEMIYNDGWADAFALVQRGLFRLAVLVVRPSLAAQVQEKLSSTHALVLSVDRLSRKNLPAYLLRMAARVGNPSGCP